MRPIDFAQVMVVIVLSTAGFVGIALGARILWRLGSKRSETSLPADGSRLLQLEQSVDAIAIEVERISEAQRYTVAVLSERLPARPDSALGAATPTPMRVRHDTPH